MYVSVPGFRAESCDNDRAGMMEKLDVLARQVTHPPSDLDLSEINLYHGSFPATKRDMAQDYKNWFGSSAFPKSQAYLAQRAQHAQQQIAACSLEKNSSQERAHVAKTNCATYACCCPTWCCFLGVTAEGLHARRLILVCQPASSCCFSPLVLSVGRVTSGPSGKALLGVNCR